MLLRHVIGPCFALAQLPGHFALQDTTFIESIQMNKIHLLSAALAAFPCAAVAQSTPTVNATLSFSTALIQNAFNLVSDFAINDTFSLGFDADYGRVGAANTNVNFDLTRLQLEPTVHFGNGAYVGAYFQRATAAISVISVSLDSAGVFAGYDGGAWAIDGYVGNTTPDVSMNDDAVPSLRNTGVTVTVRPAENLELFAHGARTSDSEGGFGFGEGSFGGNVDLSAFGGQFTLNNGVTVYAATQRFQTGDSGTALRQTALGAGFDLSRLNDNLPGTVTVEVARNSDAFSNDSTVTTLGWVLPIGKAKAAPLSSIARTARGGIRGAFVAGAGSMSLLGGLANPT